MEEDIFQFIESDSFQILIAEEAADGIEEQGVREKRKRNVIQRSTNLWEINWGKNVHADGKNKTLASSRMCWGNFTHLAKHFFAKCVGEFHLFRHAKKHLPTLRNGFSTTSSTYTVASGCISSLIQNLQESNF